MFTKIFSAFKFSFLPTVVFSLTAAAGLSGCKADSVQEVSAPTTNNASAPAPQSAPQPPAVLPDGSRASYADIVDRVTPAVVKVSVEQKASAAGQRDRQYPFGDFFRDLPPGSGGQQRPPQVERGLGSGVIVSADGTVLTNHHVIEGASRIKVEMNDKRTYDAKVVGSDPPSDLAVLKIEAQNLPFLTLGNSDQVRVGDIVLAIGNPLGIGQTVTAGIISAKGRRTGLSDGSFEDFLQTDAPINRGNSGGALVSLAGELIGINSQILSTTGGSIGIGFSIPSNMARNVLEQILKDGKVRRGQLGVVIQNITDDIAKTLELKDTRGVIVSEVRRGSAADRAGVKRGDVITAVNGERVEDSNVLRNRVAATMPGNEVALTVLRDGREEQLKATLDEFTAENAQGKNPGERDNFGSPNEEGGAGGGRLGLDLQPVSPEVARRLGLAADAKGLVVMDVEPSGPAADAGIEKGDVILEINRQAVENIDEAKAALDKAGDRSSLILIARGGRTIYVTVQPN